MKKFYCVIAYVSLLLAIGIHGIWFRLLFGSMAAVFGYVGLSTSKRKHPRR